MSKHHEPKTQFDPQVRRYAEDLALLYAREQDWKNALRHSHERIEALAEAMHEGMAITDDKLLVKEINEWLSRLLDREPEHLRGRPIKDILPSPEFHDALTEFLESDRDSIQLETLLQGQHETHVRISMSRLTEGGLMLVVHDITARERAENAKTEFLALLSHELRTPLNGILGMGRFLAEDLANHPDPAIPEYLNMLLESSQRMLSTVKNLLDFAALQGQESDAPREGLDLAELMRAVAATQHKKLLERDMTLHLVLPDHPLLVQANPGLMASLFERILENAKDFGKKGGKVEVRVYQTEDQAVIEFEDNGEGIPRREVPLVFQSFYQVQEPLTRTKQGLGLGLTLARDIARWHGGDVTLDSRPGTGTRVSVVLPLQETGSGKRSNPEPVS
jgi:two-component system sensor histidine kinase VicK